MLVHTAHLTCRSDVVEAFRERLLRHAEVTLDREPACHRFSVHQERGDPTRFLLVEHYRDEEALRHHHASEHFLQFRVDTEEWVVDRAWWFWTPLN